MLYSRKSVAHAGAKISRILQRLGTKDIDLLREVAVGCKEDAKDMIGMCEVTTADGVTMHRISVLC
jgi:hypothetical protein